MAGQLSQECEPYILPLFGAHTEALMGRNVSWLCKALGSRDLELYWRLPQSIHDEDPVDQGTNRYLGWVQITSELTTKDCALATQIYRLLTLHLPANVL